MPFNKNLTFTKFHILLFQVPCFAKIIYSSAIILRFGTAHLYRIKRYICAHAVFALTSCAQSGRRYI